MNHVEFVDLVREAGFEYDCYWPQERYKKMRSFAALVEAYEREACARVCEETNSASFREAGCPAEGGECAAAIRARGEK